jgi:hypothetical protein
MKSPVVNPRGLAIKARTLLGALAVCLMPYQSSADVVSNGTGFYIDKKTILTCAHCIPENSTIIVARSDSKLLVGRLAFVDRKLDVALLATEEPNEFWLSLGNSDSLKLLDDLSVYGFPLAATLGTDLSASQGKLNSRRKIDGNDWLQLDATMNPGNSGGPVINEGGEAVGVAVARLDQFKSLKETGALPERINFAIPSNAVKSRFDRENLVFQMPKLPSAGFDLRDAAINSTVLLLVIKNTVAQTSQKPSEQSDGLNRPAHILYPWKTHVTCTIFWVGESPSARNPKPNNKSSWDQHWSLNYGGYDDPNPANRIVNHTTGEFRPKGFIPKLNPFYIALPYNDVLSSSSHKPEAARVIPWFARMNPDPGKTVCKGRWIQIYRGGRSCFAQWEDCGPGMTDDWEFVFGSKPPKTTQNDSAGIALSPATRDYLGLKSGEKVHWRFVEAAQVPFGPWTKYGQKSPAANDPDLVAQLRYLEYLKKLRDEQFLKKPLSQRQN